MRAMSQITIPSLGRSFRVGSLYDAQTDDFLAVNVLGEDLSQVAFTKSTGSYSLSDGDERKHLLGGSLENRFEFMRTPPELAISVLADKITIKGAALYLSSPKGTSSSPEGAYRRTISTPGLQLNLMDDYNRRLFESQSSGNGFRRATHLVQTVTFGIECVVSVSVASNTEQPHSNAHVLINSFFNHLDACLSASSTQNNQSLDMPGMFPPTDEATCGVTLTKAQAKELDDCLVFRVYDHQTNTGQGLQVRLDEAIERISELPTILESMGVLGEPIAYTLFPIELLSNFSVTIPPALHYQQPHPDTLVSIIAVFERFHQSNTLFSETVSFLELYRRYVPPGHFEKILEKAKWGTELFRSFKMSIRKLLTDFRRGNQNIQDMSLCLSSAQGSWIFTPEVEHLTGMLKVTLPFIVTAVRRGASFNLAITKQYPEACWFHFDEAATTDSQMWSQKSAYFLQCMQEGAGRIMFGLQHSISGELEEGKPLCKITSYRQGAIFIEDMWKRQETLLKHAIVFWDPTKLHPCLPDSVNRRPVRMPCVGRDCDPSIKHEWKCGKCSRTVVYEPDLYFTCKCGRWEYMTSSFRCPEKTHVGGPAKAYDQRRLQSLVSALKPYDHINILILGETGVGKSTFINAFANYLCYESLEEALATDELEYLVPFSFGTQISNKKDPGALIKHKMIQYGESDYEHDGSKGQSATQRTEVHALRVGTSILRLIDTPGIGDSRGAEFDNNNMADILSVLRGYNEVHGILILLKPNSSRLTVTFKFCIQELLVHLHRSAVRNIAFGFTNTRGSNYQPGDTFLPLESLLGKMKNVNIPLTQNTVYCFDSESFRLLAAQKQGIAIGDQADYERSWKQSSDEADRLVRYFSGLEPHEVKNTTSLNETRRVLQQLVKPMTEIAQNITASIASNTDVVKEVSSNELSLQELKDRLWVEKRVPKAEQVINPQTVCSNQKCISAESDGMGTGLDGREVLKTVYSTVCHKNCSRFYVDEGTIGDPALEGCACIRRTGDKKGFCGQCEHWWQEHLHIRYRIEVSKEFVVDKYIQREMNQITDVVSAKRLLVRLHRQLIDEWSKELKTIKNTAGEFTLFLQKHSITAYNDATVDYLLHLIKEEKAKVQQGGSGSRLRDLERYLAEYKQLIELMGKDVKEGKYHVLDMTAVNRRVSKLYELKHWGSYLRDFRQVIDTADTAAFREKPYEMSGWNVSSRWNKSFSKASSTSSRSQVTRYDPLRKIQIRRK